MPVCTLISESVMITQAELFAIKLYIIVGIFDRPLLETHLKKLNNSHPNKLEQVRRNGRITEAHRVFDDGSFLTLDYASEPLYRTGILPSGDDAAPERKTA
jgi:hypothetical protein